VAVLTVWRLTKAKHAATALTGHGSMLRAGRWHPRGRPAVYAASSPALALLETLVHVGRAELVRFAYVTIPLRFDASLLERWTPADLPPDWSAWPHTASTQSLSRRWFDSRRTVVLEVPSAVVPHERNYVVNPLHARFGELVAGPAEPFAIDRRLGATGAASLG